MKKETQQKIQHQISMALLALALFSSLFIAGIICKVAFLFFKAGWKLL